MAPQDAKNSPPADNLAPRKTVDFALYLANGGKRVGLDGTKDIGFDIGQAGIKQRWRRGGLMS